MFCILSPFFLLSRGTTRPPIPSHVLWLDIDRTSSAKRETWLAWATRISESKEFPLGILEYRISPLCGAWWDEVLRLRTVFTIMDEPGISGDHDWKPEDGANQEEKWTQELWCGSWIKLGLNHYDFCISLLSVPVNSITPFNNNLSLVFCPLEEIANWELSLG